MLKTVRIASNQGRRLGVLGLIMLVALVARAEGQATTPYRELVVRIPSGSNSVVIFNVQKILNSPLGARLGWSKNVEKAFADGIVRVPPQSEGLVLAAQMDLTFLKPIWEAAVINLREPLPLEQIAKRRSGTLDMIEGMRAVALPNDTYVVQLESGMLAAMGPANRQMVLQWLREMKSGAKVSPYLQKAAGYVDDVGTEIIIATDLDGAFAPEAIRAYLESKQEWLKSAKTSPAQAAKLLASVQGLRIGIRIGEKPYGKLAVDTSEEVSLAAESCKALLIEILSDAGLKIGDLADWKPEVGGKEFSLGGNLSDRGLRRTFSLVMSPAPVQHPKEAQEKPGEPEKSAAGDETYAKGLMASTTQQQFETITKMFDDLKEDWKDLHSLSCAATFFDRYARRIEHLPVLNVDPDMLEYRDFLTSQLRAAGESGRTMGIRSGYRQSQGAGSAAPNYGGYYGGYNGGYYGGYYGGYRAGWYGAPGAYAAAGHATTNAFYDATRAEGARQRSIRNQEKAVMATDVQTIRANVIDATNKIRRTLTQRYQVEF